VLSYISCLGRSSSPANFKRGASWALE
jgi:hypothetical protein